jgi:hypothetical protein
VDPEREQILRPRPPVTRSGPAGHALHLLLAAGGWVLFIYFWFHVFYRTPPDDSAVGVLVVAVLLVVCVSVTVAWIRHNLAQSRRFQERRARVPQVRYDFGRDKLGRPVLGLDESLLLAPEVEIELDPRTDRKLYRAS